MHGGRQRQARVVDRVPVVGRQVEVVGRTQTVVRLVGRGVAGRRLALGPHQPTGQRRAAVRGRDRAPGPVLGRRGHGDRGPPSGAGLAVHQVEREGSGGGGLLPLAASPGDVLQQVRRDDAAHDGTDGAHPDSLPSARAGGIAPGRPAGKRAPWPPSPPSTSEQDRPGPARRPLPAAGAGPRGRGAGSGARRPGADREERRCRGRRLAGRHGGPAQPPALPRAAGSAHHGARHRLPVGAWRRAARAGRARRRAAGVPRGPDARGRVVQPRPGAGGRAGHRAVAAARRLGPAGSDDSTARPDDRRRRPGHRAGGAGGRDPRRCGHRRRDQPAGAAAGAPAQQPRRDRLDRVRRRPAAAVGGRRHPRRVGPRRGPGLAGAGPAPRQAGPGGPEHHRAGTGEPAAEPASEPVGAADRPGRAGAGGRLARARGRAVPQHHRNPVGRGHRGRGPTAHGRLPLDVRRGADRRRRRVRGVGRRRDR